MCVPFLFPLYIYTRRQANFSHTCKERNIHIKKKYTRERCKNGTKSWLHCLVTPRTLSGGLGMQINGHILIRWELSGYVKSQKPISKGLILGIVSLRFQTCPLSPYNLNCNLLIPLLLQLSYVSLFKPYPNPNRE